MQCTEAHNASAQWPVVFLRHNMICKVFLRHNKNCKVFPRHNMKCHPEEHRWLWDPFEPVWRQTNGWLVPAFGPPPLPSTLSSIHLNPKAWHLPFLFFPFQNVKPSNSPMCLTILSLGLNTNFLRPAFKLAADKHRSTNGILFGETLIHPNLPS